MSIKIIRSSLLPTAILLPSGLQHILMFSPGVSIVFIGLEARQSYKRTVLSPLAVTNKSELVECQHNWSTKSLWPLNVLSFDFLRLINY